MVKKILVCALCLFKSLLWILIFFDFKNRTNFHTPFFFEKIPFCNFCWKKPRASLLKIFCSSWFTPFFLNFSLTVVRSVVAVARTSAAGHPLQQAVSFLSLFLLLFLLSLIFFLRQCFSLFFMRSLFLPLFCFICLFFLTVFFPPFSKLFLFQLFFS